jgi:hypothetical protein
MQNNINTCNDMLHIHLSTIKLLCIHFKVEGTPPAVTFSKACGTADMLPLPVTAASIGTFLNQKLELDHPG